MLIEVSVSKMQCAIAACNAIKPGAITDPLIRIVASQGGVSIDAGNLEQHVAVNFEVQGIQQEGAIAVSQATLTAIVRRAQGEMLTIALIGEQLRVTDSAGSWDLPTGNISNMPVPPLDAPCPTVVLPASVFQDCLRFVLPAVSREGARPAMQGVSISCSNHYYEIAGTDGRRAHRARIAAAITDATRCRGAIVPTQWCQAVLAAKGGDVVRYHADAGHAFATMASAEIEITIMTRLIEGRFPDLKAVWPHDDKITATASIDAGTLAEALGAVSVAATDEQKRCQVTFATSHVGVKVLSERAQAERRVVPVTRAGDDSAEICLNIDYLLALAKNVTGIIDFKHTSPEFQLGLEFPAITGDDLPITSMSAIIMPMA